MATESRLFKPLKLGNMTLKHRIAMAPLTRCRNSQDHVPLPWVKQYFAQRGSVPGTFLLTDATIVSPRALGMSNSPGIWSKEQIAAWKEVADAVHQKGSFIYLQLWAMGRAADPDALKANGHDLVSSSPVAMDDKHVQPRELTVSEIKLFVEDFAQGARNAIAAGFDGVEIHGANGYLIDQFIQDTCNQRTDSYGGSIENRSRFALEITRAVVDAVGAERTAIRLSPWSSFQGMKMADPVPQFVHLIENLRALKLSYLHLVEPRISGSTTVETQIHETLDPFIAAWDHISPVLIAGGLTPELAKKLVDEDYKNSDDDVVVVFGRHFISTPDLPYRIREGLELNKYDRNTFYTSGQEGYVDYAFSDEFRREVDVQA